MAKLILLFLTFYTNTFAVFSGGQLSYRSLGGGQYIIEYYAFKDCWWLPTSTFLHISSQHLQYDTTVSLSVDLGYYHELTCQCQQYQSSCNGGTYPGIDAAYYHTIFTIPTPSDDWIFYIQDCCRDANLTILNPNTNIYLEARLNNLSGENNSAQTSFFPPVTPLIDRVQNFNPGASDPDCDSIVYSLYPIMKYTNDTVIYSPGHSYLNPFTSSIPIAMDALNGNLTFEPSLIEYATLVYIIDDYRNNVLAGRMVCEFNINSIESNDSMPYLTGINSSGSFNTVYCAFQQICFNIESADFDSNDILEMSWDSAISGATFDTSGGSRPSGLFCWTPPGATPCPAEFTVSIRDNACPTNGIQKYHFTLMPDPCTGIAEIESDQYFTIYPNPSNDKLFLKCIHNPILEYRIQVKDISGNNISTLINKRGDPIQEINISGWPAGVYFISVLGDSFKEVKRLVKL